MMTAAIRILYVDDEPDLLDICKLFLEESGDFTVTTALSAAEGIRLLEQDSFDAVVSDYQMPGMDGIQFLVEVRARFGPIPFILFTGRGREEVVIQAINSGADFYLQKGGEPGAQFAELTHKIKAAASGKRADDALRRSEERYRNIVEDQTELISRFTPDGIHVFVNEAYCRYFELKRDDILGHRFRPEIPKDDVKRVQQFFASLTKEHPVDSVEHRIIMPDGSVRWQRWSDRAIFNDSGTLIEYQSVGRDITEKKQAENERTEYQTRLKEVIEFLPDATLAIDRQKRIIVWNKAIEQMTGIPAAEMMGKGDYAYAVPFYGEARPQLMDLVFEDSEEIAARYPSIRREGDALIAEVFCNALYNNKGAWVFAKASPLYDSNGNIVGAIESIRDITGRTVAEQGLQKSEALLRDIIEKNPMSIQIVDREGYTLKVNPAFMQLFGSVPPPDFSIITDLMKSRPELENLISQVKSGEAVNLPDMCFNPHDIYPELPDVPTRVRTIIFPLNDRYGKPESFVFMHENITGCKQAEESLAESEQKFQSLVEHALEGILILDLQGKVLFANNAAARTLEIDDRAGLIGRNVMEFVAPESLEDVVKDFIEVSHGHDAYLAQYNAISAKGNKFTLESIGKVVSYEGKPADLISIRDITERKQAEVALSQSEEKFRTLFEKMTPGVFYRLSDGTLTDANPAALRMFGMTSGQCMGRNTYDPRWRVISENGELLSPDQHPSMIALKSGKPVRDLVVGVFNPKTDETTWLSTNAEPQFRNGETTPYQVFVTMYDITGRKQAEKDLLESHERFRATIASLDDAIFLVDPVTRVISECNDAATRIFGYVREELVGRQTGVLHVDQAHLEQFSQEVNASYEEPGFYTREFEMRRKDGCVFPTEHFVRPIKDNNGRLMYVVSVVRDITERKQAEVVLKESEERFHSMFERHDSVMLLIDPETGKIIDANLAAAQFYGRSQKELCSQSIDEINCLSKEEVAAERMKALREKKNFFIFPHRIASGEIRTVEVHSSPIEVGGKTVLFSIISDITERLQAENALKESEEKYRDIFENSVTGLFKINPDGALIAVNDAFARIYDYSSAAEMIADNQKQENLYISNKLYANPEDRKEIYRILAEKGKVENFETMHCKRDGTRIWMSITARFVRDPEGTVLFVEGTIIDITDRKRAEEAFKAAKEYAETLIQTANAMVIGLDSHGTITLFNKAAEAITGYTAAELAGRNWFRVIVPKEQYPQVWEEFNRLLMGGLPIDFENPILTKSGEERYIVWKNSEIRNNEETAWIISFGIDITERKRAEELLRESEKKYRSLVTTLNEGIWYVTPDLKTSYLNPRMADMLGYTVEEMNGRPLADFIEPVSMRVVEEQVEHRKKGHIDQYEIILQKKDGRNLIGKVTASPLMDEKGGFIGSVAGIEDITGRKHNEDVLTLSNRFFSIANHHQQIGPMLDEVVDVIQEYTGCDSVGIRLLDAKGNIPYTSYAGFAPSFYERESPLNILKDECMCIYVIRGDANYDLPVITSKGSFWCNGTTKFLAGVSDEEKGRTRNVCNEVGYESVGLVAIKQGDSILGLIHIADHREGMVPLETVEVLEDISQALGTAIQRLLAETGIRESLAEKEVLLQEIHHRVKNNLSVIISLIGLQISSLTDPVNISLLQDLETRVRSMALVHESLYLTKDLARISTATYTKNLTRHLIQVYGKSLEIRYVIDMGEIMMPIETAVPFGLVISEIITNSLKYAFPQSFSCEEHRGEPCTISLTFHREGNDYLLKIADNGIGIPQGYRAEGSHTLGLFLINFIVKHQMRGSIEMNNGRGTAYTIRFPQPAVME